MNEANPGLDEGRDDAASRIRGIALRWLSSPSDSQPRGAAMLELVRASQTLLRTAPERVTDWLHEIPRDGLVALQALGRMAFSTLIAGLVRDPAQLQRLRHFSSLVLSNFGPLPALHRSDVYHDAIVKLLKSVESNWPDFKNDLDLDRYLATTLRNVLRDRLRRTEHERARTTRQDCEPLLAAAAGTELPPEIAAEGRELERRVARARAEVQGRLRTLQPPQLQLVCTLRWKYECSYPDLALVWPDNREPAGERMSQQNRARWIERRYKNVVAGLPDLDANPPEP